MKTTLTICLVATGLTLSNPSTAFEHTHVTVAGNPAIHLVNSGGESVLVRHDESRNREFRLDRRHRVKGPQIRIVDRAFRARVATRTRVGPGHRFDTAGLIPRGARVRVIGQLEGTRWMLVVGTNAVAGYVHARALEPWRTAPARLRG
ncbi:MAG: hypothetical protein DWQ08_05460 [Proteobacteria bacterium]|nr:MAG: hypothetical protein DWQ08_05460 [Pseudomonadota bacterium]